MAKLTNIFGDGQVDGYNPDADGDYFQIADYGRDVNYLIEKIAEAIKAISAEPDEAFHILYGGEVTEGSTPGRISISAGVAIGKDADGNVRLITLRSNICLGERKSFSITLFTFFMEFNIQVRTIRK